MLTGPVTNWIGELGLINFQYRAGKHFGILTGRFQTINQLAGAKPINNLTANRTETEKKLSRFLTQAKARLTGRVPCYVINFAAGLSRKHYRVKQATHPDNQFLPESTINI